MYTSALDAGKTIILPTPVIITSALPVRIGIRVYFTVARRATQITPRIRNARGRGHANLARARPEMHLAIKSQRRLARRLVFGAPRFAARLISLGDEILDMRAGAPLARVQRGSVFPRRAAAAGLLL